MILWKLIAAGVRQRPGRTAGAVLSLAIGVATVVAVYQATTATRARLRSVSRSLAPAAPVEVSAADGSPFDEAVAARVADAPGVARVVPCLNEVATLLAGGRRSLGPVVGVDFEAYRRLGTLDVTAGRPCAAPDEVCLDAATAESLRVSPGDAVLFLGRGSLVPARLTVTGLLSGQGGAGLEGPPSAVLPLAAAQRVWHQPGRVSVLRVVLDDPDQARRVAAELSRRLPPGLVARRTTSPAELGQATQDLVTQSLDVAVVLAVLASTFVVLNTFLMGVAERRPQLAVMRLVGATAGQVGALLVREAVVFGAAGSVVGVPVGLAGGALLSRGMGTLYGAEAVSPPLMTPALVGQAFGVLMAVAAGAYPAFAAGRTPPLGALRAAGGESGSRRGGWGSAAGLAGAVATGLVLTATLAGALPGAGALVALALALVSGVLLLPLALGPVAALVGRGLEPWCGVEAVLAHRQVVRHRARSVLTAGVLFMVTATGIGLGGTMINVIGDLDSWFARTVTADYMVRASMPRLDLSNLAPIPESVDAEIRGLPGVERAERVSFYPVDVGGEAAVVLLREFSLFEELPLDLKPGAAPGVRRRLLEGEAVVGTALARRLRLAVGDTAAVTVAGRRGSVRVAALVGEYTSGGSVLLMDRQAGRRALGLADTHVYRVKARPGRAAAVGAGLATLARERGLLFQTLADFRRRVDAMLAGVTGGLWSLLVLGLFIAAFGISNTLGMSVLEQTRYLGLLRAVGMTRAQVGVHVLCQALVVGGVGLVPGTAAGVGLAVLVARSFHDLYGHSVPGWPRGWFVAGCFAAGLLLVVASSALPAWRAARLDVIDALHEP